MFPDYLVIVVKCRSVPERGWEAAVLNKLWSCFLMYKIKVLPCMTAWQSQKTQVTEHHAGQFVVDYTLLPLLLRSSLHCKGKEINFPRFPSGGRCRYTVGQMKQLPGGWFLDNHPFCHNKPTELLRFPVNSEKSTNFNASGWNNYWEPP